MDPEVLYYLDHHEPSAGPPRRLKVEFEDSSYCIILFNEFALEILKQLVTDNELKTRKFVCDGDALVLELNQSKYKNVFSENAESTELALSKQKSWFVYFRQSALVVFTKSSTQKQLLPPESGYVITGKENMLKKLPIKKIGVLSKSEKTTFVADRYGDSYNDSFQLEPRIVDSIPSTVFKAISNVLDLARKCYLIGTPESAEAASEKYRKAFHYCHKYYPDDLSDDDLKTATDLKIRSLLNLALCALKTEKREWYRRAIESCDVVLGMPELETRTKDTAKALYRRGYAHMLLGDEETAEADLKRSISLVPDMATKRALEMCNEKRNKRKNELRQRLNVSQKNRI